MTETSPEFVPDFPRVGLFATCLVDLMRPSVGFAAVQLLEDAGCRVEVPEAQTCCGQPAYNSGDLEDTRKIAANVIAAFEAFDYVVVPSGSCAGTLSVHYPKLFENDADMLARANTLAGKTHELLSFLTDVMGRTDISAELKGTATYHDSCSGLRELGIKEQPRALLAQVDGLEIKEGEFAETCCGFGGLFCVKYPDISENIVDAKIKDVEATGADMVLGGDVGCLLNIAGRLKRQGSSVQVRHAAEVLAGMTDTPAMGDSEGNGTELENNSEGNGTELENNREGNGTELENNREGNGTELKQNRENDGEDTPAKPAGG